MLLAAAISPRQTACSQLLCQNSGTCQVQGLIAVCICKPGFTGQRCESGRLKKVILVFEIFFFLKNIFVAEPTVAFLTHRVVNKGDILNVYMLDNVSL